MTTLTMPTLPSNYHNRFDRTKGYDRHLFLPGVPLQDAELNEIQTAMADVSAMALAGVYTEGDVITGGAATVNQSTGAATLAAGTVFAAGRVWSVGAGTLTVPTTGTHLMGVRLLASVIDSTTDTALVNPAGNPSTMGVPGAERLKVAVSWGWDGDGAAGDFCGVYTVIDGVLQTKMSPFVLRKAVEALSLSAIGGKTVNLIVKNNVSTPNTKMDVSADSVLLFSATGTILPWVGVNLTVNFSTTGSLGIDTGSVSNSTWYHLWMASNGTAIDCRASLSATAPSFAAGYDWMARIGAARVDGSGHLVALYQRQNEVACARQTILASAAVTTQNIYESLNISAFIPSTATRIKGIVGTNTSAAGTDFLKFAATSNGLGQSGGNAQPFVSGNAFLTNYMFCEIPFEVMITVAHTTYWTQAKAVPNTGQADITGWWY